MNRHPGDTPLTADVGVERGKPDVTVRPVQGPRGRSNREPNGPAGKLAAAAQVLRRWHQLVGTSSTVRELENEVYQLTLAEERIYKRQRRRKKIAQADTDALARLGRFRELAEEVRRQREAAIELENNATIAFHDGFEPTEELSKRLAEANRDWDKLLLRLYALSAPPTALVTLALFAEHRTHLAELAFAYRSLAHAQGLLVQATRYDLPDERDTTPPPPPPPPPPRIAGTMPSIFGNVKSEEPEPPATTWFRDRLFQVKPVVAKLLVRKVIDAANPDEYRTASTIGVGVMISGPGAHVRYCGEAGLHAIHTPDDAEGGNPDVLVFVESQLLLNYAPPVTVVRKGLLKDRPMRRAYDRAKGVMTDFALERAWSAMHGPLANWLDPAIAANMRLRLMKLIVE
jgi:hypothetical protein